MRKRRTSIALLCFMSSTAYAVGGDNTHTQGVSLAGRGFDESVPLRAPEPVPWFEAKWPPPPTATTYKQKLGNGRTFQVVASCTAPPAAAGPKSRFAMCSGAVSLWEPAGARVPTAACDLDDASKDEVPLLAVQGKWRQDGSLDLSDDRAVTFACAPTFPPRTSVKNLVNFGERKKQLKQLALPPIDLKYLTSRSKTPVTFGATLTNIYLTALDLSNINTSVNLGVIAKCYFWGFAKDEARDLKTYEACIRAARADYCGDGKSQTQPGTWIQIYETPETNVGKPIEVAQEATSCNPPTLQIQLCFEALWDEGRALCVSHARFLQMPIRTCGSEFKVGLTNKGEPVPAGVDPVLHCRNEDYKALQGMSRVKNRSGINDINGRVWSCQNDIACP